MKNPLLKYFLILIKIHEFEKEDEQIQTHKRKIYTEIRSFIFIFFYSIKNHFLFIEPKIYTHKIYTLIQTFHFQFFSFHYPSNSFGFFKRVSFNFLYFFTLPYHLNNSSIFSKYSYNLS